jgi:hypothetical protein
MESTKPTTRSESTAFLNPMRFSSIPIVKPPVYPSLSTDILDESISEWNINKKRKEFQYEYACSVCKKTIRLNPLKVGETLEPKLFCASHSKSITSN